MLGNWDPIYFSQSLRLIQLQLSITINIIHQHHQQGRGTQVGVHAENAVLWKMPYYGKCHIMENAVLWKMPYYGKCHIMENAILWKMPYYGKCHIMENAVLWKMPYYGKCHIMENAVLWKMPYYGKCHIMENAILWKMPYYGKCRIMENAILWKMPYYGKCRIMETDEECLCCRGTGEVPEEYFGNEVCITENENFRAVCVHGEVLKTTLRMLNNLRGDEINNPNWISTIYYVGT